MYNPERKLINNSLFYVIKSGYYIWYYCNWKHAEKGSLNYKYLGILDKNVWYQNLSYNCVKNPQNELFYLEDVKSEKDFEKWLKLQVFH